MLYSAKRVAVSNKIAFLRLAKLNIVYFLLKIFFC